MIDRRTMLTLLGCGMAAPTFATATQAADGAPAPTATQTPAMSRPTAYAFSFTSIDGGSIRLADHSGKPILVVNTASQCGYTPQFTGLQQLWTRYHGRGLLIVGVPSNDFGGQEPGGAAEINKTAHDEYGIGFPLAAKTETKGPAAHPFYRWAAAERPGDTPRWNFHKYLVGHDGHIASVFPTQIEPTDARVIAAIERELKTV